MRGVFRLHRSMGPFPGPPWRRGTLRPGDRGPAVRRLQERLQELGYEPGVVDGVYGVLTEDAVRRFQREYRLFPDGVCGPRTARLLFAPLELFRLTLSVEEETSWEALARAHGVSRGLLEAAGRSGGHRRPYPGQRVVLPRRWLTVTGVAPQASSLQLMRSVSAMAPLVSARVVGHLTLLPEAGELDIREEPPLLAGAPVAAWAQVEVGPEGWVPLLHRARIRRRLLEALQEWRRSRRVATLVLRARAVPGADGRRFLRFLGELCRSPGHPPPTRPPAGHPLPPGPLLVAAPAAVLARRRRVIFPDLWQAVAARQLPLVVDATADRPLTLTVLERALRRAVTLGSALHTWLWLPLDALAGTGPAEQESLTYSAALSRIYRYGGRLEWVEASRTYRGRLRAGGVDQELLLEPGRGLASKLSLANRYQVYGVLLGPVGGEDREVWRAVRNAFVPLRSDSAGKDGS